MTLAPILAASFVVQLHVVTALTLIPLTAIQFWRPKRGNWHRWIGWAWVALMTVTAVSSFWIHGLRLLGPFSPIHALSLFTLANLYLGIRARRQNRIVAHRSHMIGIAAGWAVAGLFTLLPGRIMGQAVFGG